MLKFNLHQFILNLQDISPEYILASSLLICYILILVLFFLYKEFGLYLYISLAIISCNLQILKGVKFNWYHEPIALGTIIFATIFLASDMLNEYYGAKSARKSINLSFISVISLLLMMLPVLAIQPIDNALVDYQHFNIAHKALSVIFIPNIYILIASLIAYFCSQMSDIYIFAKIKLLTEDKALWLRTAVALIFGCFIDTVIFNLFAWKILSPEPVSFYTLVYSYILSGYSLQILVSLINIPVFYLIKKITNKYV